MRGNSPNNLVAPRIQPWTDAELALIDKLAPGKPRARTLREAFPGRTIGSIRQKLHIARTRLGLCLAPPSADRLRPADMHTTMLDPDDPGQADTWHIRWSTSCAKASDQYLAALQRLAA